jgi:uncharacterized protein YpmB
MDPLMTFWLFLIGIIVGILLAIIIIYRAAVHPLHKRIEEFTSEKKLAQSSLQQENDLVLVSQSTYPYSKQNFRYIDTPIDGVQFENDQILFVIFKHENEQLTSIQRKIKQLVKTGKVHWFEYTIS